MAQQEGRLVHGPGHSYTLHGLLLREKDPLDILVGTAWIAGNLHNEASDENWYYDAGLMSIPLYGGRKARFRLELVVREPEDDEELLLAALTELGDNPKHLTICSRWDEVEHMYWSGEVLPPDTCRSRWRA